MWKAKRGRRGRSETCVQKNQDKENRRHVLTIDKPSLQLATVNSVFFFLFLSFNVMKNDESPHSYQPYCELKYLKNFKYFGACHIVSMLFFFLNGWSIDIFFCLFRISNVFSHLNCYWTFPLFVFTDKNTDKPKHTHTREGKKNLIALSSKLILNHLQRFGRFCVQIPFRWRQMCWEM